MLQLLNAASLADIASRVDLSSLGVISLGTKDYRPIDQAMDAAIKAWSQACAQDPRVPAVEFKEVLRHPPPPESLRRYIQANRQGGWDEPVVGRLQGVILGSDALLFASREAKPGRAPTITAWGYRLGESSLIKGRDVDLALMSLIDSPDRARALVACFEAAQIEQSARSPATPSRPKTL